MYERDYDLLGKSGKRAVEIGLAAAEWYLTDVPRKEMKKLMRRRDGPAIRDTIIYYGAMIALAAGAICLLAKRLVDSVLPGLWRALRQRFGQSVARSGTRHGFPKRHG